MMKTRLSFKIFAAFLAMSFMVVVLMAVSYRYVVVTSFWNYVNQNILGRLNNFTQSLSSEYQTQHSWDHLKADPEQWFALMMTALPRDDFSRWPFQSDKDREGKQSEALKKQLYKSHEDDGGEESEERMHFLALRLARGLALFDSQHQYLVGGDAEIDPGRYSFRPIVVDGKPVGWLGLLQREHTIDPFLMDFIKQQSLTFYSIGGVILLLAAMVSLILSRHLLKPIRRLSQGTRALTSFRFDTRIAIRSQDELGQLAIDFNRMADTLKEYETMRQQWLSDISHELRTPLAILKGEIEALQDGVRKVSPETLESLHSEVLRLSKLVADLHALSLADSQNLQAAKQEVRPLEILAQMVAHYQSPMESHGINLQTDIESAASPIILGDRDRLAQLFSNLLENTLRYTDAPGILKIMTRQADHKLTIWFEDSAPGVPSQSLDRIFERLYRVDSSRNRSLGGSGLGLAICKQIVTTHGGAIRAEAADLGGLRIQIDLPLKYHGPPSFKEAK